MGNIAICSAFVTCKPVTYESKASPVPSAFGLPQLVGIFVSIDSPETASPGQASSHYELPGLIPFQKTGTIKELHKEPLRELAVIIPTLYTLFEKF